MMFSDGIGRSGTFCALMISIYEFKAEQKVDIFQIIKSMRSQRPGMVASAVSCTKFPLIIFNLFYYRTSIDLSTKAYLLC